MSNSHPPPIPTPSSSSIILRDYRKGNWTLQETLTLITAKRLDDDRRSEKSRQHLSGPSTPRSAAELRWKWIENYCCANGCLRSQNQCNDKWDNLLRDYKKVLHHESSKLDNKSKSYWEMENLERKEKSLPSNLAIQVFDALKDVLSRRSASHRGMLVPVALFSQQQHMDVDTAVAPPPLVPAPQAPPPMLTQQAPVPPQPSANNCAEISESSDSEAGDTAEPDWKRQKIRDTGSSVVQGASMLARTLLACEDKRDKRHRDWIELQQRRLRAESDRTELNRQGFAGLISAVNSLSNAIHAFVSQRDNQPNGNARSRSGQRR